MKGHPNCLTALGVAAGLLICAFAQGLPADRNQAIQISADRALRDELRGYTIYNGDVRLTQGSLVIEADRLTMFHSNEGAERIVAEGLPARMQQRPAVDKAILHAAANKIIYLRAEERIQLRNSASVEQDGAVVSGELIDYLIPEQLVRANAQSAGEAGRVQVVIPAQKLPNRAPPADAPAVPEPPAEPVAPMPTDSEADLGATEGS